MSGAEWGDRSRGCTGADLLLDVPCDLLVERVLLRLPVQTLVRAGQTCKRMFELVGSDGVWEKLFSRDFSSLGVVPTASLPPGGWPMAYRQAVSLDSMAWEGVGTGEKDGEKDGEWPCCRWGHSMVVIDNGRVVVFGGESQDATCADVQVLDTATWKWESVQCTGCYPERRFGHSCVYYKGNAIVFGGSKGAGYYDDLICLDVKRWHWWRPQCTGTPPVKRSSHSMTVVGNKGFVFGGIGGDNKVSCLQDIAVLDLDTWAWAAPAVSGPLPSGRFVHRVVRMGEGLLLFGGRTSHNQKFNDVHWFDTRTLTWTAVVGVEGEPPCARGGCSLVAVGHKVLVFCGRAEDDSCLFDGVHMLTSHPEDPSRPPTWSSPRVRPKPGGGGGAGCGPSPRGAHGFVVVGGKVVVFGGYGPNRAGDADMDESSLNDLFVLNLIGGGGGAGHAPRPVAAALVLGS